MAIKSKKNPKFKIQPVSTKQSWKGNKLKKDKTRGLIIKHIKKI